MTVEKETRELPDGSAPDAPEARPGADDTRILLYVALTAVSAACGLIVEIAAGRIIAPYLGMSLYTWTAVIAVVLAGFSLGHWIGGRLASRPPREAAAATAWHFAFAGITALAILPLLRIVSGPILALELPAVPTILLLTTALFFAPSVFVGIPSPVLTKLAVDEDPGRLGPLIGLFFAAGAVGSIAGTLLAGYVFISWLGSTVTILTVAVIYALLAAAMAWDNRRRAGGTTALGRGGRIKAGLVVAAVVLLVAAGSRLEAFKSNCDTESDYYCIRTLDGQEIFGVPSRILVLDHLSHGINVRDEPKLLVSSYAELQDRLAADVIPADGVFRALFMGGGAYTIPRAWLAKYPKADITVSEIDPAVTRTAIDSFWLAPGPRLEILDEDARRTLLRRPAGAPKFDVILGDAFHDISVPPHLVTREFYELVRANLTDGGIYLMNVIDHPERPRFVVATAMTLRELFPSVEIWASNEPTRRATFIVRAGATPTPRSVIGSRMQPGVAWQRLSPSDIQRLETELSPMVLTDDYAPVDRLLNVE